MINSYYIKDKKNKLSITQKIENKKSYIIFKLQVIVLMIKNLMLIQV